LWFTCWFQARFTSHNLVISFLDDIILVMLWYHFPFSACNKFLAVIYDNSYLYEYSSDYFGSFSILSFVFWKMTHPFLVSRSSAVSWSLLLIYSIINSCFYSFFLFQQSHFETDLICFYNIRGTISLSLMWWFMAFGQELLLVFYWLLLRMLYSLIPVACRYWHQPTHGHPQGPDILHMPPQHGHPQGPDILHVYLQYGCKSWYMLMLLCQSCKLSCSK
jgi:hypothetical protein